MGTGDYMAGTCSRLPILRLLEMLIRIETYLHSPVCHHDVVFN